MEWAPQQDEALRKIDTWFKTPDAPQIFRLFGYAGTGKTTLAKTIAEGIDGGVCFGTFTGKAAYVLQTKGCAGATTIHQLIYNPKDKSRQRLKEMEAELAKLRATIMQGGAAAHIEQRYKELEIKITVERRELSRPSFVLNTESEVKNSDLVIIDECSMVNGQMGEDLLSFGTKVLVLGDPAQLPPVGGDGFFIDAQPDFMLTEIHRQARDNPIIRMATEVREGRRLSLGAYGDSKVIGLKEVDQAAVLASDQLIVGKNATRHAYNRRMRTLRGFTEPQPLPGDRVVCLRNNHELGLLNGSLWNITDVAVWDQERVQMTVESADGFTKEQISVEAHAHPFFGGEVPFYEKKEAQEFDYGYALTCHKSQGSQWNDVHVFDESFVFRENRDKWLYTAITRAAEKVTVVKM